MEDHPLVENIKVHGFLMSIRQLSSRIELTFWQVAINLLSESRSLQRLVRWFYLNLEPRLAQYTKRLERRRIYRWSAAGLGLGFFTGILISVF